MQKPKFRTVEKSAWIFVTTKLHPRANAKINKRTASRCGYLASAAALLGVSESSLPMPFAGEAMSKYVARVRAARAAG
jgi:hypothetical protein